MSSESALSAYDVVVLDEVHERHLHGDFLLGIMKCIIQQKPDLKLVLMSATINIELFSNYFAKEDVKIIEVSNIARCVSAVGERKGALTKLLYYLMPK